MVGECQPPAPSGRETASVRTPISRRTSVIGDHEAVPWRDFAPSSIVSESSGTSDAMSAVRTPARAAASWARALRVEGQLLGARCVKMHAALRAGPAPCRGDRQRRRQVVPVGASDRRHRGRVGSGKSSLALGVLYAEARAAIWRRCRLAPPDWRDRQSQRRYVLYVPAALALHQRPVPGICYVRHGDRAPEQSAAHVFPPRQPSLCPSRPTCRRRCWSPRARVTCG